MKKLLLASSITMALVGCGAAEDSATPTKGSTSGPQAVSVSVSSIAIKEGDSGQTPIKVEVTASKNVENDMKVRIATTDATAKSGVDYVGFQGDVVIVKGTRTVAVPLYVIGNATYQPTTRSFEVKITETSGENMTITTGVASTTVQITDDDPAPIANFTTDKITAHEDIGNVQVPFVLDRPSASDTVVNLSLSGLASQGTDYSTAATSITVPAMTTSGFLSVDIVKDSQVEGTENIDVKLASVTGGTVGKSNVMSILISGDLHLPDTGVRSYFNQGAISKTAGDALHPMQDADFGHDTNPIYQKNGTSGFVYQKIDLAGNPMPAEATTHSCVYDNHTGLTWEQKTPTYPMPAPSDIDAFNAYADSNWHSHFNRYMWRNQNAKTNGGSSGGENSKEFENNLTASDNCAFPSKNSPLHISVSTSGCTSDKLIEVVNKAALCGFKDWRLPSVNELATLVNYEHGASTFDGYFNDTTDPKRGEMLYLSATPSVDNTASVWCLNETEKKLQLCNKQTYNHIRLVRGTKL